MNERFDKTRCAPVSKRRLREILPCCSRTLSMKKKRWTFRGLNSDELLSAPVHRVETVKVSLV